MTDKRWKALTVPYEVVLADETEPQCYRLSGKTVQMLLAMIEYMEWRTRWRKSDGLPLTESELDNVKSWAAQGAYELMSPEPCADESCEDGDCVAYYPTNPKFSYAPNNPFEQCESSPAGYLTCPLVSGLASGIPGALPDDIYCTIPTLLPAPPLGLIDQVLNSGFPRVHFEFSGSGEIEVHLLEVAQGGLSIIRIDDVAYVNVVNLQGISIADIAVSLDFIVTVVTGLLDWQFVNEKIVEFSIPSGDHTLDILFIPNLSLNILETGWGGGLRSVVLCGEFTVVDCPDTIIDPIFGGGGGMAGLFDLCWFINEDGTRTLRYTINGGCTWNDVSICGDSIGEEIPPVDPIDPIDVPGGAVDPELNEVSKCRVAVIGFEQIIGYLTAFTDFASFLNNVVGGETEDISGNLLGWLQGRGANMGVTYIQYFAAFKAVAIEYHANADNIIGAIDGALVPDHVCSILACLPDNGALTRSVLNCVADVYDADGDLHTGEDYGEALHLVADYLRIYPLEWARLRALAASANTAAADCDSCDDEPDPEVCAIQLDANFVNTEEDYGFTWATGDTAQWTCGAFAPPAGYTFQVGTRGNWGWTSANQTSSTKYAVSIIKTWIAETYNLCQLQVVIPNSTGRLNTRMAAVWVKVAATQAWQCLASKKIAIYSDGAIELLWTGDMIEIDAIVVAALTGGQTITIQRVNMNYGVPIA